MSTKVAKSNVCDPALSGYIHFLHSFFELPRTEDDRVTAQKQKTDNLTVEDLVSPGLKNVAKAEIRYLSAIIASLVELLSGPEADEHGILRPTREAFSESSELLVDASICAALSNKSGIPVGYASTDEKGGVRIEWMSDTASVFLIVPANGEGATIYRENHDTYDTIEASAEELADSLLFLL